MIRLVLTQFEELIDKRVLDETFLNVDTKYESMKKYRLQKCRIVRHFFLFFG